MNGSELATKYCDRMGKWKLDWEVLMTMFECLLQDTVVTEEQLNKALEEGLNEWDI